jgi:hypothetical protein
MVADAEGSSVFFTDDASAGLTSDTAPGSGANLYQYDLSRGTLTDLTPVAQAGAQGVVGIGAPEGEHPEHPSLYFVAGGALTGKNAEGHEPENGQPNLYAFHAGAMTFIATLASSDSCDWTHLFDCAPMTDGSGLDARVSANGRYIAFESTRSLTGYHNTDVVTGNADSEIFLYDTVTGILRCASCNPSGAAPLGAAVIRSPAAPSTGGVTANVYPQRNLTDSGQVFFETPDALVPADVNGKLDVYEYERGRAQLISTGTSEADSYFLDASANGSDAFFVTAQRLLPGDTDAAYDIYDARVGGGFAEPAGGAPPCSGEGCRGAAESAPSFSTPGSASFAGPGNTTASPPPASVKVLRRAVRGSRLLLSVSVPGGGLITISGSGVQPVRRTVAEAGVYQLSASLTRHARRALRRRHLMRVRPRVSFAPVGEQPSAVTVVLTVKG